MSKEELTELLRFLKSKKITAGMIAETLAVSQGYISDMKTGVKPVTDSFIHSLKTKFPAEYLSFHLLGDEKSEKGEKFHVKKNDPASQVAEEIAKYTRPGDRQMDLTMKVMVDLAAAHKELAESNNTLSKNQEVILSKMTASGGQEISVDEAARWSNLLELLAEIGSGHKRWESKKQALAELSKFGILPKAHK